MDKRNFFSIIIPAHNEEKYIAHTLEKIQGLRYPKDLLGVFVIENGSTDKTLEIAQKFSDKNITVISSQEKGVSKAKNLGLRNVSEKSDWVVFLDADTILEQTFLEDLNGFLVKNERKNFVIGTTSVKPLENTGWYARAWMHVYDFGHILTKTSLAIQIMRTKSRGGVFFDETKKLAEDLQFIQDLLLVGKFFYFPTNTVLTSTRRFETVGWMKLFIQWTWGALIYKYTKKNHDYPVIR